MNKEGEHGRVANSARVWTALAFCSLFAVTGYVRATTYFVEDFEPLTSAWSFWDDGEGTTWSVGEPSGQGPGTCHAGTNCLGTNLGEHYEMWSWAYANLTVDLTGASAANLTFWHWYEIPAPPDGAYVEVNGVLVSPLGDYPSTLDGANAGGRSHGAYRGSLAGWDLAGFDLTPFVGGWATISFALVAGGLSGGGGFSLWFSGSGWYIDDIRISDDPVPTDLLTVTGSDLAPPTLHPGDLRVPMQRLDLTAASGSVLLRRLTFSLTGTGSVADIERLWIDLDANGNGLWDSGEDGHWRATPSSNTFSMNITLVVSAESPVSLFLLFEIAERASPGVRLGIELLAGTSIAVNPPDAVATSGFPIRSGNTTVLALPPPLLDDVPVHGTDRGLQFYYQPNYGPAVVAMRASPGDDFDLEVHRDLDLDTALVSSTAEEGRVDLVVLDENSFWAPRRGVKLLQNSWAWSFDIEAVMSPATHGVTDTLSGYMDAVGGTEEVVDAFHLTISDRGQTNWINVSMDPLLDLDVFLYEFDSRSNGNRTAGVLASSDNRGPGLDENLTFVTPNGTREALLVITNEDGGTGGYVINPRSLVQVDAWSVAPAAIHPGEAAVVLALNVTVDSGTANLTHVSLYLSSSYAAGPIAGHLRVVLYLDGDGDASLDADDSPLAEGAFVAFPTKFMIPQGLVVDSRRPTKLLVVIEVDRTAPTLSSFAISMHISWYFASVGVVPPDRVVPNDPLGLGWQAHSNFYSGWVDINPPPCTITSPTSGSAVGGEVTVTGTAANVSGLLRVETRIDEGPWTTASGTLEWTSTWNTAKILDRPHRVEARVLHGREDNPAIATCTSEVTVENVVRTFVLPTAAILAAVVAAIAVIALMMRRSRRLRKKSLKQDILQE